MHSGWASSTAVVTVRDGACVHDRVCVPVRGGACVPVRGRACVPVRGRACVPVLGRIHILSSLFFKLSYTLVWLYHRTVGVFAFLFKRNACGLFRDN